MDFELNETQAMVRETARAFSDRVLRPRAAEFERAERVPAEVLKEMAELGLMGVNVPAALGGSEAGAVSYALAMREIARGCAATAVTMAVTNMVSEVIAGFEPDRSIRPEPIRLRSTPAERRQIGYLGHSTRPVAFRGASRLNQGFVSRSRL